jgi:hypothetical protein
MSVNPGWKQAAQDAANARGPGYEQLKGTSAPGPASVVKVKGVNVNVSNQEARRQRAVKAESGGARTALAAEGFSEAQINQAIGSGKR